MTQIPKTPAAVAAVIDHTLLRPDASREEILRLCKEAKTYGFATVCVNSFWVPQVRDELKGSTVKVCTVIGFPLGAIPTAAKVSEVHIALRDGAQELDMVLNLGLMKSRDRDAVLADVKAVAAAAHAGRAILKVILETALLNDAEKFQACRVAQEAGADFVKTSTGFAATGATPDDVRLMRQAVGPSMGVKASGGIRTLEDVTRMLEAGATRIGASSSVQIIQSIPAIATTVNRARPTSF